MASYRCARATRPRQVYAARECAARGPVHRPGPRTSGSVNTVGRTDSVRSGVPGREHRAGRQREVGGEAYGMKGGQEQQAAQSDVLEGKYRVGESEQAEQQQYRADDHTHEVVRVEIGALPLLDEVVEYGRRADFQGVRDEGRPVGIDEGGEKTDSQRQCRRFLRERPGVTRSRPLSGGTSSPNELQDEHSQAQQEAPVDVGPYQQQGRDGKEPGGAPRGPELAATGARRKRNS